ncbi:MAG TPA: potassium channel protein [Bacteroidota bacterium]
MNPFKEALQLLGLLVFILLVGMFGYHFIEGWPMFDALYMTVITLATVGYGETHALSTEGRMFTIFLIMGGMGIILYGVTEVTAFIIEGEMTGFLRRRRMQKSVRKLSHHYIVCGAGKTGMHVVEELVRTKRPCVIIEQNAERAERLTEQKRMVLQGDATEDSMLTLAGVERAAGLVTTLPSDKDNLFVVITARGMSQKLRIVAKISDLGSRGKFLRNGADSAVSANFIGGLRMASELIRPDAVSFLDTMLRDNSDLRVEDIAVGAHSRYSGATLAHCNALHEHGILLVSMKRGGSYTFNPPSQTKLQAGDSLIVIGTPEQIQTARKALNHS